MPHKKRGGAATGTALNFFKKPTESGGGRDVRIPVLGARAAGPAARLGRFLVGVAGLGRLVGTDRGRQGVERNALIGFLVVLLVTGAAVGLALAALLEAVVAVAARAALRTVAGFGLAVGGLGLDVSHFVALVAVLITIIIVAIAALIFKAHPALAEDTEIMVRELKVIFGLDPVAGQLRVARHALVFLKQLGGVAALTIVLAVTAAPRHSLWALPTAATTTAALTIIDQAMFPYRTCASFERRKTFQH
jgi:hypothetical protein